jgi:hypothetical protein
MSAKTAQEAFVEADVPEVEEFDEVVLTPAYKSARVKGTWLMFWGDQQYDFVDKQRFSVPADLYEYLRKRDCIYDTIA